MTISHLRLQEASEGAINCPPHTVPFGNSDLDDDLRLQHLVDVDPNAFSENILADLTCILILRCFRTGRITPEAITTPMTVLL